MTESNIEPTDIFVNSGTFLEPYYEFYLDEAQTIEVSTLYLSKRLYKFQRINQANTHPFFISDSGYKTESTKITFSGDGNFDTGIANNESFIVDLSNLTVDDTLYYYCTAHDSNGIYILN